MTVRGKKSSEVKYKVPSDQCRVALTSHADPDLDSIGSGPHPDSGGPDADWIRLGGGLHSPNDLVTLAVHF